MKIMEFLEGEMVGSADVAGVAFDSTLGTPVVVLENGRVFRLIPGPESPMRWADWEWEEHAPVPGSRAGKYYREHVAEGGREAGDA